MAGTPPKEGSARVGPLILYFDNYITNVPMTAGINTGLGSVRAGCAAYRMPDKLSIAKYTLASYAELDFGNVLIKYELEETIYMGDGIFDAEVFQRVGYSICPSDGFYLTRQMADFVTVAPGGNRAVAEACVHILNKFYHEFEIVPNTSYGIWKHGGNVDEKHDK
jgi:3-deoxy-D-manno-octulosonate 8-phosphate phosphatase KdsC-like HAD superfamily phosphatase